jgi:hypothetical protein
LTIVGLVVFLDSADVQLAQRCRVGARAQVSKSACVRKRGIVNKPVGISCGCLFAFVLGECLYGPELPGILSRHWLALTELSTHLQGQLVAVHRRTTLRPTASRRTR